MVLQDIVFNFDLLCIISAKLSFSQGIKENDCREENVTIIYIELRHETSAAVK